MIALLVLTVMPLLLAGMGLVCYALGSHRARATAIARFRRVTEPLVFLDRHTWAFLVAVLHERGVEIVQANWNGDDDGAVERLLAEARRDDQS